MSVDTFFYNLGAQLNADPASHPDGGALQQWARKLRLRRAARGSTSAASSGHHPLAALARPAEPDAGRMRARLRDAPRSAKRAYPPAASSPTARTARGAVGDNTSLAVGQGDFLATPLQMAVAYAAIENGGTIVRPHVGLQIDATARQSAAGDRPQAGPSRRHRLHRPGRDPGRPARRRPAARRARRPTCWPASRSPVYGKTGTAQFAGKADQSWYVAYVPDPVARSWWR